MKARAIILISGVATQTPDEIVTTTLKPFSLTILDKQSILLAGRVIMALEIEIDPVHIDAIEMDLRASLGQLDIACELI